MPSTTNLHMRRFATSLIMIARNIRSQLMLPSCRLVPSCSTYIRISLQRHGYLHGALLSLQRLMRCHPLSRAIVDPVPETRA